MAEIDHVPTDTVGGRRVHVGAWTHGLSLYGRQRGRDAAAIPDDELSDLVRAALEP